MSKDTSDTNSNKPTQTHYDLLKAYYDAHPEHAARWIGTPQTDHIFLPSKQTIYKLTSLIPDNSTNIKPLGESKDASDYQDE